MPKWKKLALICLCFAILSPLFVRNVSAETSNISISTPTVSADSAMLIEGNSGVCVYEKNAKTRLPMASTTKIMTALVALESASPDTVIPVPACAVGTEGSSVYLIEGESLTLEQLLYALLLESANDAAVAIAVGIAGSVEAFADKMNAKAETLGLVDTHFTNPHGLDDEDHYTTAHDLACITQNALQNESFRTIVSTRKTTIPHAGTDGVRLLVNHNKMLRLYEDCIGVKTGYTQHSGRCLVSAAERNGVTMIAVTLNAPNDWDDHQKLLDYGFSKYTAVTLCQAEDFRIPLSIVGGVDAYVTITNRDAVFAILPTDHGEITYTVQARNFEYATINTGDRLGSVIFSCDTDGDGIKEIIGEVILTAAYSVERAHHKKSFWQWICSLFGF